MTLEEKKERLRAYTSQMVRLERKCEEAARWASLAETGEPDGSNPLKITVIQIRDECEQLAEQVKRLRQQLIFAFEQLPGSRYRDVLEMYYLQGMNTTQIGRMRGWSGRYVRRLRSEAISQLEAHSHFFE